MHEDVDRQELLREISTQLMDIVPRLQQTNVIYALLLLHTKNNIQERDMSSIQNPKFVNS
jgi:hypothetical protein